MEVLDLLTPTETELKPKELLQALSHPQLRLALTIMSNNLAKSSQIANLPLGGESEEILAEVHRRAGIVSGFTQTLEGLVTLTKEESDAD